MYVMVATSKGMSSVMTLFVVALFSSALASGFFYSIKDSLKGEGRPDFNTFYTGVGKYYAQFLGILVLFFILAIMVIIGTFVLSSHVICNVSQLGLDSGNLFMMLADPNYMEQILTNLTPTQQLNIKKWNNMFLVITQTYTFLLMYWIPEKMYTDKGIFKSLIGGVSKLFSDFPNSLCIFLTILFFNYVLAIISVVFSNIKPIIYLTSILSLYLLVYDFYLIFAYYKAKFVDTYDRG
jgi:hypothetical protein